MEQKFQDLKIGLKFHESFKQSFIKFHKVSASFTKFQYKIIIQKLLNISYKFECILRQAQILNYILISLNYLEPKIQSWTGMGWGD